MLSPIQSPFDQYQLDSWLVVMKQSVRSWSQDSPHTDLHLTWVACRHLEGPCLPEELLVLTLVGHGVFRSQVIVREQFPNQPSAVRRWFLCMEENCKSSADCEPTLQHVYQGTASLEVQGRTAQRACMHHQGWQVIAPSQHLPLKQKRQHRGMSHTQACSPAA